MKSAKGRGGVSRTSPPGEKESGQRPRTGDGPGGESDTPVASGSVGAPVGATGEPNARKLLSRRGLGPSVSADERRCVCPITIGLSLDMCAIWR